MKYYEGRVPACGVFCGGCPMYLKEKKPCPGAQINSARCDNCKSYHLCCQKRGINHCFECGTFPCAKFKAFTKSWTKYGENLVENQHMLQKLGETKFLKYFNSQIKNKQEQSSK